MTTIAATTNESFSKEDEASRQCEREMKTVARACLAGSFLVVILCSVLATAGLSTRLLGALLGLSAGLVGAYIYLGWLEFTDDVARLFRRGGARHGPTS